jgi:hypothetical protein
MSLLTHLGADFRQPAKISPSSTFILVIGVSCMLCGADGFEDIDFDQQKTNVLARHLLLSRGIYPPIPLAGRIPRCSGLQPGVLSWVR